MFKSRFTSCPKMFSYSYPQLKTQLRNALPPPTIESLEAAFPGATVSRNVHDEFVITYPESKK